MVNQIMILLHYCVEALGQYNEVNLDSGRRNRGQCLEFRIKNVSTKGYYYIKTDNRNIFTETKNERL